MSVFVFTGSGSLGHTAPAIAIAQGVQQLAPAARCYFLLSDKLGEVTFAQNADFPVRVLPNARTGFWRLWDYYNIGKEVLEILKQLKPKAVCSTGGHQSIPICKAAAKLGIPVVLFNADSKMGRANAYLQKYANTTVFGLSPEDEIATVLGYPVRQEVLEGNRKRGLSICGFDDAKPILLLMGGSQGAQALNEILDAHLPAILVDWDVIHVTGRGKQNSRQSMKGYYVAERADSALPHFYSIAQAAIIRGGAGSIGELSTWGVPSIVVPLEGVKHAHQLENALIATSTHECLHVIRQPQLSELLMGTLKELIAVDVPRKADGNGAAKRIAEVVIGAMP